VKVLVTLKAPLFALPEIALAPDHAPLAVHELALVEDQVRVVEPFGLTVDGFALRDTVGGVFPGGGPGGGGLLPEAGGVEASPLAAPPPLPQAASIENARQKMAAVRAPGKDWW
jgi:hypothetical protein